MFTKILCAFLLASFAFQPLSYATDESIITHEELTQEQWMQDNVVDSEEKEELPKSFFLRLKEKWHSTPRWKKLTGLTIAILLASYVGWHFIKHDKKDNDQPETRLFGKDFGNRKLSKDESQNLQSTQLPQKLESKEAVKNFLTSWYSPDLGRKELPQKQLMIKKRIIDSIAIKHDQKALDEIVAKRNVEKIQKIDDLEKKVTKEVNEEKLEKITNELGKLHKEIIEDGNKFRTQQIGDLFIIINKYNFSSEKRKKLLDTLNNSHEALRKKASAILFKGLDKQGKIRNWKLEYEYSLKDKTKRKQVQPLISAIIQKQTDGMKIINEALTQKDSLGEYYSYLDAAKKALDLVETHPAYKSSMEKNRTNSLSHVNILKKTIPKPFLKKLLKNATKNIEDKKDKTLIEKNLRLLVETLIKQPSLQVNKQIVEESFENVSGAYAYHYEKALKSILNDIQKAFPNEDNTLYTSISYQAMRQAEKVYKRHEYELLEKFSKTQLTATIKSLFDLVNFLFEKLDKEDWLLMTRYYRHHHNSTEYWRETKKNLTSIISSLLSLHPLSGNHLKREVNALINKRSPLSIEFVQKLLNKFLQLENYTEINNTFIRQKEKQIKEALDNYIKTNKSELDKQKNDVEVFNWLDDNQVKLINSVKKNTPTISKLKKLKLAHVINFVLPAAFYDSKATTITAKSKIELLFDKKENEAETRKQITSLLNDVGKALEGLTSDETIISKLHTKIEGLIAHIKTAKIKYYW